MSFVLPDRSMCLIHSYIFIKGASKINSMTVNIHIDKDRRVSCISKSQKKNDYNFQHLKILYLFSVVVVVFVGFLWLFFLLFCF